MWKDQITTFYLRTTSRRDNLPLSGCYRNGDYKYEILLDIISQDYHTLLQLLVYRASFCQMNDSSARKFVLTALASGDSQFRDGDFLPAVLQDVLLVRLIVCISHQSVLPLSLHVKKLLFSPLPFHLNQSVACVDTAPSCINSSSVYSVTRLSSNNST